MTLTEKWLCKNLFKKWCVLGIKMKGEKRQQQTQKHFFQLSYFNLVSEQAIPDYPYLSILSREGTAPFSCNVYKNTDFFFFFCKEEAREKEWFSFPTNLNSLTNNLNALGIFWKFTSWKR